MSPDAFELHLPPRADHLGTARAFVGWIARSLGMEDDVLSDLQLAVSEACTDALDAGTPIRVRLLASAGSLEVEVGAPDRMADVEGLEGVHRIELVRALFPDASVGGSDGARVLRFAAPLD